MSQRRALAGTAVIVTVLACTFCGGEAPLLGPATRPATRPSTQPAPDQQALTSLARKNLVLLVTALDQFQIDCGRYPTDAEGLAALVKRPADTTGWQGPYVKTLVSDPWGRPYHYRSPGQHNNDFDLFSTGPDGREGGGDDITNWDHK